MDSSQEERLLAAIRPPDEFRAVWNAKAEAYTILNPATGRIVGHAKPVGVDEEVRITMDDQEQALAAERMERHYAFQRRAEAVPLVDAVIAGAIYDFMGVLTTGPRMVLGREYNATVILDVFGDWAEKRGLNPSVPGSSRALVREWAEVRRQVKLGPEAERIAEEMRREAGSSSGWIPQTKVKEWADKLLAEGRREKGEG